MEDVEHLRPFVEKIEASRIPNPWGETEAAFKERMHISGLWREFLIERSSYRARGLPPRFAQRLAQQHYPPMGYPVRGMKTGIKIGDALPGHTSISEADVCRRIDFNTGASGARTGDWKDRTCSFAQAMEWVFENLFTDATVRDAPSKQAWSTYVWAKALPSNGSKFMEMYLDRRMRDDPHGPMYDPGDGLTAASEDVGGEAKKPGRTPPSSPKAFRPQDVELIAVDGSSAMDDDNWLGDDGDDDVPTASGVSGALARDSDGSDGEPSLEEKDELRRFA